MIRTEAERNRDDGHGININREDPDIIAPLSGAVLFTIRLGNNNNNQARTAFSRGNCGIVNNRVAQTLSREPCSRRNCNFWYASCVRT